MSTMLVWGYRVSLGEKWTINNQPLVVPIHFSDMSRYRRFTRSERKLQVQWIKVLDVCHWGHILLFGNTHGYTIDFGYNLVSQFTDIITVWFVHSLLMGLGWYLKQSYLVQWNLVARKIFLIKCCIYSMILHYRFAIAHVTYVHIHLLFSCWSFCVGKKATVLEISSLPFPGATCPT